MSAPWIPARGEVIYIQFSPHVGKEMPDEHPMLVLSERAFNEKTDTVIGVPMTHSAQNEANPFAIPVQKGKEKSYILCSMPKSFDWKQRGAAKHPWGMSIKHQVDNVLLQLKDIIG